MQEYSSGDGGTRLREPPGERFDGPEIAIDIDGFTQKLHDEHPPVHGHRQIVVYRRGGVTVALYEFEEGATLPQHQADGLVLIQPLDGPMSVNTPKQTYYLHAGRLLALDPNVPHDVLADEAGRMLMTVCLSV